MSRIDIPGQMSLLGNEWQYDEDTGGMMCRCPVCGGRMSIHSYLYWNPYYFCPYCGEKLSQGRIWDAGRQIYEWDDKRCQIGLEHRPY